MERPAKLASSKEPASTIVAYPSACRWRGKTSPDLIVSTPKRIFLKRLFGCVAMLASLADSAPVDVTTYASKVEDVICAVNVSKQIPEMKPKVSR